MWKIKKEEPIPDIAPIEEPEETLEDLQSKRKELEDKLKKIETRKTQKEEPQINKQELIDIIEGNLNRSAQLIELLRRI